MKKRITSSIEDYVEAIYQIRLRKGTVRVRDIARRMGVSLPSVTGILRKLSEMGLVVHERYGDVELTVRGEQTATEVSNRHQILSDFLRTILNVDGETADRDACQIEHVISDVSLERVSKLMTFVESFPEGKPSWLMKFKYYAQRGQQTGKG